MHDDDEETTNKKSKFEWILYEPEEEEEEDEEHKVFDFLMETARKENEKRLSQKVDKYENGGLTKKEAKEKANRKLNNKDG